MSPLGKLVCNSLVYLVEEDGSQLLSNSPLVYTFFELLSHLFPEMALVRILALESLSVYTSFQLLLYLFPFLALLITKLCPVNLLVGTFCLILFHHFVALAPKVVQN